MNRGMTLIELLTVLVVTGTLVTLAAPRLGNAVDGWVVREAREELIALLYRARLEARRHGEARVVVESGGGAELLVAEWEESLRWEPEVPGLGVEVAGSRDRAEISFGPAGLGRVASTTLIVRRGRAEQRIVVSSYGRVRR